jgi:hypothetical protein
MIAAIAVVGAMKLKDLSMYPTQLLSVMMKPKLKTTIKLISNLSVSSVPHHLNEKQDGELIDVSSIDVEKNIQVHKTEKDTSKYIQTSTDLPHT